MVPSVCGSDMKNCFVCQDDLCNDNEFPSSGRLACLTCTGTGCAGESQTCEIYGDKEKCVSVFDGDDQVIARGCKSATTLCIEGDENCAQCDRSNCNTHTSKLEKSPCIVCNSKTDEDKKCVTTADSVGFCSTDSCYSILLDIEGDDGGQNIKRGCTEDIDLTTCVAPDCVSVICEEPYCNNKNFPTNRKSCFKCTGADCSYTFTSELCILYSEISQCITKFNESEFFTIEI